MYVHYIRYDDDVNVSSFSICIGQVARFYEIATFNLVECQNETTNTLPIHYSKCSLLPTVHKSVCVRTVKTGFFFLMQEGTREIENHLLSKFIYNAQKKKNDQKYICKKK